MKCIAHELPPILSQRAAAGWSVWWYSGMKRMVCEGGYLVTFYRPWYNHSQFFNSPASTRLTKLHAAGLWILKGGVDSWIRIVGIRIAGWGWHGGRVRVTVSQGRRVVFPSLLILWFTNYPSVLLNLFCASLTFRKGFFFIINLVTHEVQINSALVTVSQVIVFRTNNLRPEQLRTERGKVLSYTSTPLSSFRRQVKCLAPRIPVAVF